MIRYRIAILDGFRAIAILTVMFFHFFSRWTPPLNNVSLYPYGSKYDYFGFGYYGVTFFFIISGFVIFFTLDNTTYFASFWKKRMIRLVPSIIMASLLTFIVLVLFDNAYLFPGSHEARNFLPSWTFITPEFFNRFSRLDFGYIDGSYWSLWPEIQFYFLSSIIFYLNKKKFVRNFVLLSFLLIITDHLFMNVIDPTGNGTLSRAAVNYKLWIHDIFNLVSYLAFFSMGVLFYLLFKNKNNGIKISFSTILCSAVLLICTFYNTSLQVIIFYCMMYLLFLCFIYYPRLLAVFENKLLVNIGICSYFLYLIHQNLGVFLINKLGPYFSPVSVVFTLLLFVILIWLSRLYTEKIDKPVTRSLKKMVVIKD
ncbi:MAG TPA: acyltransferase [Ferruginibacter sp.]|nr:acyltransferase [Ferruginibacter sp.]